MSPRRSMRAVHPGEVLREDVIPTLGKSKVEIARLLGLSTEELYDLVVCRRPVTPTLALKIGALTGTTADSWLEMQARHDGHHSEQ